MMVTFDICAGNPGALQFLMQAYDMDMFKPHLLFCLTIPFFTDNLVIKIYKL